MSSTKCSRFRSSPVIPERCISCNRLKKDHSEEAQKQPPPPSFPKSKVQAKGKHSFPASSNPPKTSLVNQPKSKPRFSKVVATRTFSVPSDENISSNESNESFFRKQKPSSTLQALLDADKQELQNYKSTTKKKEPSEILEFRSVALKTASNVPVERKTPEKQANPTPASKKTFSKKLNFISSPEHSKDLDSEEAQLRKDLEEHIKTGNIQGASKTAEKLAELQISQNRSSPSNVGITATPAESLSRKEKAKSKLDTSSTQHYQQDNQTPRKSVVDSSLSQTQMSSIPSSLSPSSSSPISSPASNSPRSISPPPVSPPRSISPPPSTSPPTYAEKEEKSDIQPAPRSTFSSSKDENSFLKAAKKTKYISSQAVSALGGIVKGKKKEEKEKERILFSDYSKRLESFSNSETVWPYSNPSPEELAYAGLFFKPSSSSKDRCKCYSCGTSFNNWLPNEDPSLRHRKIKPNCAEVLNWGDSIPDDQSLQPPRKSFIHFRKPKRKPSKKEEIKRLRQLGIDQQYSTRPPTSPLNPSNAETSPQEELAKAEATLQGLEKLVMFYASDPVAQATAQQVVDEQKKKIESLRAAVESQYGEWNEEYPYENYEEYPNHEEEEEYYEENTYYGDWEQFTTETGEPYWYNYVTQESRWENPLGEEQ